MKKLKIMIFIIIITFSFFLLMYNRKRSYSLDYIKDGYNIKEEYNKNDKVYLVTINTLDGKYSFIIDRPYSKSRKLVENIKELKVNDEVCLTFTFKASNVLPACYRGKELVSYALTSDKMKSKMKKYYELDNKIKPVHKEYENININYLNNKKIFVWNYHGFYYLNNNKNKTIDLFKRDIYKPMLIGYVDNHMIMPDYNNLYEYTNFKVMNVDNLSTKDFEISEGISDDSYILGVNDKSIFIYDSKYKREFEIVPFKLKYRIVDPFIYNKGEKQYKSDTYLTINKNTSFIYDTLYDYRIIDNKLYRYNKYNPDKELISDLDVKFIVKKTDKEVYYISGDTVYLFNENRGNIKLFTYFELDFNYENLIYIFD